MSDKRQGDTPVGGTLADRINWLFRNVKPEGQDREYSGRDVVSGVQSRGTELSNSHLSELRRGAKSNPTLRVLQGLAEFFEVKVAFFFDDDVAREVEADVALRNAMRDAQVRDLAFRVAGLAPDKRDAMYRLLSRTLNDYKGDNLAGGSGDSPDPPPSSSEE